MNIPSDCKYTKEHEWVRVDNSSATIGITDYAQHQLGDVVFVELPEEGDTTNKGEALGVVESVKAVSDIYAPVSGEISEINSALKEAPETLNTDCYDTAWLVKIDMATLEELDDLLTPEQYAAHLADIHE